MIDMLWIYFPERSWGAPRDFPRGRAGRERERSEKSGNLHSPTDQPNLSTSSDSSVQILNIDMSPGSFTCENPLQIRSVLSLYHL